MLNLLFISDSPKVDNIKSVLQPVLKVIIDVVADFDQGLKNVFEKRPATVCIQDQIGGVTGESVARHIQMLLGNGAPTFILLYTGTGKAKTVKGLYEHYVDLGQSGDIVAEEIKNTLKLLLGDQWAKVYIPPALTASSVRSTVAVPEESRKDADKLVDDILSDLETSGSSYAEQHSSDKSDAAIVPPELSVGVQPGKPQEPDTVLGTDISGKVLSTSDEMADLLLAEVKKSAMDEQRSDAPVEPVVKPAAAPKPVPAKKESIAPAGQDSPASATKQAAVKSRKKSEHKTEAAEILPQSPVSVVKLETTAVPQAAEFVIRQKTAPVVEQIPEDLLLAFESNYRTESKLLKRSVIIAIILAVSAAGGWYLVKQDPQLAAALKQRFIPSSAAKHAPAAVTAAPAQKTLPLKAVPVAVTPALPQFIPKEGRDSSYALKNPGWERYVGKSAEFRVFTSAGRIQALQVLAVINSPISESFIKSVLQEFAGSPEYQITSRKTKAGVLVESGRIRNKDEILIYRKRGAVKAFVVSII